MAHTAVTTPGTLRLLLTRDYSSPGTLRSRTESRRLLLARDYSWTVTPANAFLSTSRGYVIHSALLRNYGNDVTVMAGHFRPLR